jgi:hypothetical protein
MIKVYCRYTTGYGKYLELNKIYTVTLPSIGPFNEYILFTDDGEILRIPKSYFLTTTQWRNRQINLIFNGV